MKRKIVSDYVEENDSYTLIVDFEYYEDTGTWDQPSEEDLQITRVQHISEDKYNNFVSADITDLFYDYCESSLYNNILNYAKNLD
mgnify:CR=1 FL=1|jgi:hypothetical protein